MQKIETGDRISDRVGVRVWDRVGVHVRDRVRRDNEKD
jgi:hypothetical protein